MDIHKDVLSFINKFKAYEQADVLAKTFLNGFCYWFAVILSERFPGSHIQYEPIEGHFVTEIGGRLYDIRGDVTETYRRSAAWYSEEYCMEFPSIVNGCMLKTEEG